MTAWLRAVREKLAERWRWFWGLRRQAKTRAGAHGRVGEAAAAQALRDKGWKIVARNWFDGADELDLVAWDGEVLVFCEVRARAANALVPGYHSVTKRKKRALARAAAAYLRGMEKTPAHFRFDIVEVRLSDGAAPDVLVHANIPLFPTNFQPARGGRIQHG